MAEDKQKTTKKTSIGGQALIEGIMMRGPERTAMAVRHVSGEIVLEEWDTAPGKRAKIWKLPFIRGIFNMVDSLRFGYKCLMRSAELAGLEDEEEKPAKKTEPAEVSLAGEAGEKAPGSPPETSMPEIPVPDTGTLAETEEQTALSERIPAPAEELAKPEKPKKKGEELLMTVLMVFSSLLGIALAVVLFMWLPSFFSKWLGEVFPVMTSWVLKSIVEGVLRILLFVGYLLVVSLMKDIRRTFMYHGAEHKTIFCYEHGEALTVENVRRQRRFHPRCGTSFMILVLLVGIIISMFIHISNPLLRTGIKLLTLPIVVGIGYELIKLAGRKDNLLTRIISAPGMWLQHVTTKEPDDSMIECAIAALKKVIPEDPEADNW